MKTEKRNTRVMLVLSILGLLDSSYLSWIKLTHNEGKCIPGVGDCGTVNTSIYSELFGIPVAYLGVACYLVLLVLVLLERKNGEQPLYTYLFFGVTLVGFLFSIYLTYLELAVIHAVCVFCMISAILLTILFGLSLYKIKNLLNN